MARLGTIIRLAERRHAGRDQRGADGAIVELDTVTVRFGDQTVVDAVSASVAPGEWVALIGANGAGKTTLLRAVAGLLEYQGAIRLGGRDAGPLARRERAHAVSYVPQSPELPADMSVFDYVLLGRTPHISYLAVESSHDLAHCAALIDRLQLGHLARRHLSTLSGGERQRVVLARALAQEAPVLLMDEPTSALDMAHRIEALEIVDELRHDWGLTVVSVLHDLTLAGQFADRLLLLGGGTVIALGTPAEVLDEAILEKAFGSPVRIIRTDDGELVIAPRRSGTTAKRGSTDGREEAR